MDAGLMSEEIPQEHPAPLADDEKAAVARISEFLGEHPGDGARAVINYLGRPGARVVVVADDRAFGDVVVSSVEAGERACAAAGVTVGTWDRETSAKLTPSPADRRKMAGTGR